MYFSNIFWTISILFRGIWSLGKCPPLIDSKTNASAAFDGLISLTNFISEISVISLLLSFLSIAVLLTSCSSFQLITLMTVS